MGCRQPRRWISLSSCSFRASDDRNPAKRTRTSKCAMLWLAELKWVATGSPVESRVMDRRCSATLSASRLFVSPTYNSSHNLHRIAYMQSVVVQVKLPFTSQDDLGPLILGDDDRTLQVLHLGLRHGEVPMLMVVESCSRVVGSFECTNICRKERSFLKEMSGGSVKIRLVS